MLPNRTIFIESDVDIPWSIITRHCQRSGHCEGLTQIDQTPKRKGRHIDQIFVMGSTGSCHHDNFRCSQLQKLSQMTTLPLEWTINTIYNVISVHILYNILYMPRYRSGCRTHKVLWDFIWGRSWIPKVLHLSSIASQLAWTMVRSTTKQGVTRSSKHDGEVVILPDPDERHLVKSLLAGPRSAHCGEITAGVTRSNSGAIISRNTAYPTINWTEKLHNNDIIKSTLWLKIIKAESRIYSSEN